MVVEDEADGLLSAPRLIAKRGTERRSERDTRERVQCVWVRMGPVRATAVGR